MEAKKLHALGLDGSVQRGERREVQVPGVGVGSGATPTLQRWDTIKNGSFTDFGIPGIWTSDVDPAYFRISRGNETAITCDRPDRMVLDHASAYVAANEAVALLLNRSPGSSTLLELEARRVVETTLEPCPAPVWNDIIPDALVDGWLVGLVRDETTMATPLRMTMRAGTLVRLWVPRDPTAVLAKLPQLFPHGNARQVAQRWFDTNVGDSKDVVQSAAIAEAEILQERLSQIEAMILDDAVVARQPALQWIHARDDLESAALLAGGALGDALGALDRAAAELHTMWSFVDAYRDDPRLRAVFRNCPECWWGMLAVE